jgi:exosome complex component RRP4
MGPSGEHVDARENISEDPLNNTEQQHTKSNTNAIPILSTLGFNLTLEVMLETSNLSSTLNLAIDEMLGSEFHVLVAEREAERRTSMIEERVTLSSENQSIVGDQCSFSYSWRIRL